MTQTIRTSDDARLRQRGLLGLFVDAFTPRRVPLTVLDVLEPPGRKKDSSPEQASATPAPLPQQMPSRR